MSAERVRVLLGVQAAALAVVLHVWPVRVFRDTPDLRIVSAPATSASVPHSTLATGTVQPTSSITVGTTLSGPIESVEAGENAIVHKGQVLARLDPVSYQTALSAARDAFQRVEADLERDQIRLANAERDRSPATPLAMSPLAGRVELTTDVLGIARLEEAVAVEEGQLTDAYAAVNRATMNLELTTIRSPVDGIVLSVARAATGTTGIGDPVPGLFRIATDLSHLQVQVVVAATDPLRAGDKAAVDCDGHPLAATVLDIRSRMADPAAARSTQLAVIEVQNPNGLLRPGMVVPVTLFDSQPATVVRIPNRALTFRPDAGLLQAIGESRVPFYPAPGAAGAPLSQVWEFNGTEFTAVWVRTGAADGEWTELVAGAVRPGDRLVTSAALGRD